MKILSVSVPMENDDPSQRRQAVRALALWLAKIDPQKLSMIDVDAKPGQPLVTYVLTEAMAEGLKALLVWAQLYFIQTDNHKNDELMTDLLKAFRCEEPPKDEQPVKIAGGNGGDN